MNPVFISEFEYGGGKTYTRSTPIRLHPNPLSPRSVSHFHSHPVFSRVSNSKFPARLRSRSRRRTLAMFRRLLSSSSPRFLSTDLSPQLGIGSVFHPPPNPSPEPPPRGLGFHPSPSKDADAIAHILITHHNPYHPIETSLQLAGTLTLTPPLTFQTLIRLKHHSKIALSFFLFARDHALSAPDADTYDLMVDILGRVRQFDVVWQLIVEMDQRGVAPTPRTFGVLMRRYVAAGFTRLAIRAFDDMEGFIGREPNGEEFKMLVDTLCKYGYPKIATEIFNKRKSTFKPDENVYTILIYGWCKINRHDMAQKFLKEMIDRGLEPNVVTYNVLLNGICRRASLHPDSRFDQTIRASEDLLNEMRSRGIEPDVTSYSIVLHVYSRAHKPELTVTMLNSMKERGICPTVATYTSVIKCLASCGRVEEAEKLLDEMASTGVSPSAAMYNCFFKEYRGRKDTESAIKLYRRVKGTNHSTILDIRAYNILVAMFTKLNKMEFVLELWNDMKEIGVGPDLDSYTLLIHELCKKQKWREACEYFMEMIEMGFLPQKVTFETLYRGLIQSDMLRTWRRLKNKVEEEALKFGSEFQQYQFKPYKR